MIQGGEQGDIVAALTAAKRKFGIDPKLLSHPRTLVLELKALFQNLSQTEVN